MISLFWGLWQYLFSKAEVHLLIIGLDYAGKTTLLEQLKTMFGKKAGIPLDKIPPTVGLNIAKVDISRTNVIFWDLGGQERLRAIWSKYYSESHGVVFVVDSSDPARFDEARAALASMLAHPELSDVPLLVLANKSDLDTAQTSAELTARLELDRLAESHQWTQRPISALTTSGIADAVTWFVSAVKQTDRFQAKQQQATNSRV
ncbi:hypothetical protein H257_14094 [Aphanomyces astaci]|uniref:ADP-ribosylation factor-like protein 3 n=1 Tax=Aphanomyces astaci TaxID=112090 RepID=W4FUT0_APHAT|nr:hypothetical protein H257_14094 [Aphanomyces astaci]ETV70418.1 hypothetical protein H257_14094 [Aphanomyces astaci]|eukprot:XP_009840130.1 hypothetical protein H257_14094 [Aphanomyces astaci]